MTKRLFFVCFLVIPFICGPYLSGTDATAEEQNRNYLLAFLDFSEERMKTEFGLELEYSARFFESSDKVPYLSFNAHRRASLDEARALEMAVLHRAGEMVQAFERSYTEPHSFSIDPEFVRASIRFIAPNGRLYDDGSINHVALYDYRGYNPEEWRLTYKAENAFKYYYFGEDLDYFEDDADPYFDDDFPTHFYEYPEEIERLNALSSITNPAIHQSQPFERELDEIMVLFKRDMNEKHDLDIGALGWMEPGQNTDSLSEIRTIGTYYGIVGLKEARALMLKTSENLLHLLNDNATIHPYLAENPFPAHRLKFRILFRYCTFAGSRADTGKGSVSTVTLYHGKITYRYIDPNSSKAVSRLESYQEAQEILENTPPSGIREIFARILRQVKYCWGQFWLFIQYLIFALFVFIFSRLGLP